MLLTRNGARGESGGQQTDQTSDDPTGPTPQTFPYQIGKHHSGSHSPARRGTKGYIVYDVDRERLTFLKDYWYDVHKPVDPETDVHRNPPEPWSVVCCDSCNGWRCSRHRGKARNVHPDNFRYAVKRHHRFVVKGVGMPLHEYKAGWQLMFIVHHALLGE